MRHDYGCHGQAAARRIGIIILALALSSCGFKLRGWSEKPTWLYKVAMLSDRIPLSFKIAMKKQLTGVGIIVTQDPTQAPYWLKIESATMEQQVSSISSSTTPRQYQLIYTVQFQFQKNDGQVFIATNNGYQHTSFNRE